MSFAFIGERVTSSIWHQRVLHLAFPILQYVESQQCLPMDGHVKNIEFCESFPLGKSSRLPFSLATSVASHPLELVHSDIGHLHSVQ